MENKIQKLEEEFEKTKKEIAGIPYLKKGSITRCYQVCRNLNCRCHKNEKFRHGPYYLWTTKENDKTKTISVPKQMLSEVKSYIDNFNFLKSKVALLEEISEKIIKIKIKNYREELKKNK
ncbi:MAG: DUF6788 family protein [Candidatus Humimicrobiaceae bacterium]